MLISARRPGGFPRLVDNATSNFGAPAASRQPQSFLFIEDALLLGAPVVAATGAPFFESWL